MVKINQRFDWFWLYWSFNWLFWYFNWSFWSLNQCLIELRLKKIDFISKSWSSTRFGRWIWNRTEINKRIWISDLIQRRWFDLLPLIALAYFKVNQNKLMLNKCLFLSNFEPRLDPNSSNFFQTKRYSNFTFTNI